MKSSINYPVFLTIINFVLVQSYYYDSDYSEGASCRTVAGFEGTCTPRSTCPSSRWSRNRRDICRFENGEKIVCCMDDYHRHRNHFHYHSGNSNDEENDFNSVTADKNDDNPEKTMRISEQKFEEYMNKIFSNKSDTSTPARKPTLPGQYPHMSAIGFTLPDDRIDWKCGGNLISEYFVLTAAHCANDNGQTPDIVSIGDLNLAVQEENLTPQTFGVKMAYIHPYYNVSMYYHDIGLLELSKKAMFTEFVRPACLWGHYEVPYDSVVAMGYGSLEFGGIQPKTLSELTLSLMSNADCNTRLPPVAAAEMGVIDTQICAMDYSGRSDTCQGDSGGPLQLNLPRDDKTYYYLVGITSYGIYCGGKYPSVYTRISSYADWIEHIVWPY